MFGHHDEIGAFLDNPHPAGSEFPSEEDEEDEGWPFKTIRAMLTHYTLDEILAYRSDHPVTQRRTNRRPRRS
jgi:hypothetical protein